jgi:hypothetical protein
VGRVGGEHGEGHVDARLNKTRSSMLFRAKSVEDMRRRDGYSGALSTLCMEVIFGLGIVSGCISSQLVSFRVGWCDRCELILMQPVWLF